MNQILPQRLRALREEKGLTQEKLAKELGVARMTIVCYESGKNSPDGNMLSKMCAIFDCTPDYLFGFSNLKNPQSRQAWMASVKTLDAAIKTLPQQKQETLVTALNSLIQDNFMLNETVEKEDLIAGNIAEFLAAYAEIVRCLTAAVVNGDEPITDVFACVEDDRSAMHRKIDFICRALMQLLLNE